MMHVDNRDFRSFYRASDRGELLALMASLWLFAYFL
jgi:hypothetical protein